MIKVVKIIRKLQTLKTNDSIRLLRKYQNNENLQAVLNFVFNPYVVSGISDKKFNKDIKTVYFCSPFNSFVELLEYIQENNTGTDVVIYNMQQYCKGKPEDIQMFIKEIVTKSLKIGLDAKGINKAFDEHEEFIPVFGVQLANKFYDVQDELKEKGTPFTLTLKLDGQRCLAIKHNGKITLRARSGKVIEGCLEITRELENIRYDEFVLDGELLVQVVEPMTSIQRYTKTMEILRTKDEKRNLEYMVFDGVEYNAFVEQKNSIPYLIRRNIITSILVQCTRNFAHVALLPNYYCGNDYKVIDSVLKSVIGKHLEGLMLNINSAPYRFDRTNDLLKIKVMQDTELKCIGVEEGSGKNKGTLGAIICKYKDDYTVKVGTGFSNYLRDRYWKNPNYIIGQMITVQYTEESKDAKGNLSLRFPVFKAIREFE